jgi:hypothetical protein
MNKYQNGKIYEIFDKDDLEAPGYFGSTCRTLKVRKACHKNKYTSFLNGKHNYVTSFEIIREGNWDIKLIENFPCETNTELERREGFYIRNNPCVNKVVPGRTNKEYCEDNKEKRAEYLKQFREQYKEKRAKLDKEKYERDKERILARNREKINCPFCSKIMSRSSLCNHKKNVCKSKPN